MNCQKHKVVHQPQCGGGGGGGGSGGSEGGDANDSIYCYADLTVLANH
jgi:hypothetical protein